MHFISTIRTTAAILVIVCAVSALLPSDTIAKQATNEQEITEQDTRFAETVEAIANEVAEYGLLLTRREKLDFAERVEAMVDSYGKDGYVWALESPEKFARAIRWLKAPEQTACLNGVEVAEDGQKIDISPKVVFHALVRQSDLRLSAGTIAGAKKALRDWGQQKARIHLRDSTYHNLRDLVGKTGKIAVMVSQINSSNSAK